MASIRPPSLSDGGLGWLEEMHNYAAGMYGEATMHAWDVLRVYRGEYTPAPSVEDSDIEIVRSSMAYNIVNKFMSMVAIRSRKGITVIQDGNSTKEAQLADRLERGLQAYLDETYWRRNRDPLRDSAYYAVMRGRAGLLTVYDPLQRGMRVRMRALDPFNYFPVYGEDGIEFFTQAYRMSRLELKMFADNVERGAEGAKPLPTMDDVRPEMGPSLRDEMDVIEYWDEDYHAYRLGDEYFVHKHEYGFVPLTEFRFNETPETDQRWAHGALLSGVLEDLKLHNATMSKLATGVEQFTFPRMYYITADGGGVGIIDHHTPPGDWVRIKEGTQPIVLNPAPNRELLQDFLGKLEMYIGRGTLNPVVYTTDLPDVSGFLVSQFMSIVQDDLADKRDPMQRGFGMALGKVLRLMERFGPDQDDGGWRLPITSIGMKRPSSELLTAEDIDGHYNVRVSIRVALPEERTQMMTQFNQARAVDSEGHHAMDWETAWEFAKLDEVIPSTEEVQRRRRLEWLLSTDQQTQALYAAYIKAENADMLREWEKAVQKHQDRQQRQADREAARLGDEPFEVPPELKYNSQVYRQLADWVDNGGDPLDFVDSQLALQAGQGEQGGQSVPPEDINNLVAGMQVPDGMTGYEGVDPRAMPPAMQGALPRRSVDQPNLQVEKAMDTRSPALPPRK